MTFRYDPRTHGWLFSNQIVTESFPLDDQPDHVTVTRADAHRPVSFGQWKRRTDAPGATRRDRLHRTPGRHGHGRIPSRPASPALASTRQQDYHERLPSRDRAPARTRLARTRSLAAPALEDDMTQHFDAIVIGTGQAGPPLAARLSGAGMKVAIIERGRFGGTCVNTGCIPTKTLIASAYAAQLARRAGEYGVSVGGPVTVDMKAVKARKDQISGRSNHGVEQWVRGLANTTVFQGHARFEQANTVRVGDDVLEAERIFINVGGRAGAGHAGPRHGALPDQRDDDGRRLPARASRDRRRQLHRRVRPDVSPLRLEGHDRRAGFAPDPARGRGRVAGSARDSRKRRDRRAARRDLPERAE